MLTRQSLSVPWIICPFFPNYPLLLLTSWICAINHNEATKSATKANEEIAKLKRQLEINAVRAKKLQVSAWMMVNAIKGGHRSVMLTHVFICNVFL